MVKLIWCSLLLLPLVGQESLHIDERAFAARFGAPERYPADMRMPFVVAASSIAVLFFWRRMRRAEHRAADALLVKSRLLANLSHELQTPMNAILGLSHLLLETRLDIEQRESIDAIRKSAGNLQTSIQDLLDLSTMRHGLTVASIGRADVLSLVEEVTAMISPAAREKGLAVGLCFHADVPRVAECDSGKARQVLIHLMANAVKFTSSGSITTEVTRRAGLLQFAVKDTGPGIDRKKQKDLFREFVSGDDSATRAHRGLGLGLALCKQWLSVLGGEIGVTSVPGEGSTFWFALPVAFHETPESCPLAGRRALVIDDGSVAIPGLKQSLARLGFSVVDCSSAALALRILRDATIEGSPFHYVFLDDKRDALDRETVRRSLMLDARSARTQVLPAAFMRLDVLRSLLAGEHQPEPGLGDPDVMESLAALMVATSAPTFPAATPYPKTGTRNALTA